MQPFLFYAELVEKNVLFGDPARVRIRVIPNPDYVDTGGNTEFNISFSLGPAPGTPVFPDGFTNSTGINPVPKLTQGGIFYYNFSGQVVQTLPYVLGISILDITGVSTPQFPPVSFEFFVVNPPAPPTSSTPVSLSRYAPPDTDDEPFWDNLKASQLKFKPLHDFVINSGLCNFDANSPGSPMPRRLPFVGVGQYSILKFAVEAYMVSVVSPGSDPALSGYLITQPNFANAKVLPYYDLILQNLQQKKFEEIESACHQKFFDKIQNFSALELIYDYWMDQGGLVQAMNLICLRFQNRREIPELTALYRLDTNPLLPLTDLLWGYIEDEQHTVSLHRRVHEYDHEYGLTLIGKAVPNVRAIDSRSSFLEAFHTLLHKCALYYVKSDDTTYIADGLPVLNAVKEVNILLAQGNHNAYGNLTFAARHANTVQQFLLAQPEMDRFLGGRAMVPYAEPWQGAVETIRGIMGWGNVSIRHFHNLATFGELILLSVRYGNWSVVIDPNQAANWANAFRNEIMQYIHSYRAVTGVDLSADTVGLREEHFMQPSVLIQRRMTNARSNGNGRTTAGSRVSLAN